MNLQKKIILNIPSRNEKAENYNETVTKANHLDKNFNSIFMGNYVTHKSEHGKMK